MNFIDYSHNRYFFNEKQDISKDNLYKNRNQNTSETRESSNSDRSYMTKNINISGNNSFYSNKLKKRVKFNENISIIYVKSFKRFNKREECFSINEHFDKNYNYRPIKRKSEENICQCNII